MNQILKIFALLLIAIGLGDAKHERLHRGSGIHEGLHRLPNRHLELQGNDLLGVPNGISLSTLSSSNHGDAELNRPSKNQKDESSSSSDEAESKKEALLAAVLKQIVHGKATKLKVLKKSKSKLTFEQNDDSSSSEEDRPHKPHPFGRPPRGPLIRPFPMFFPAGPGSYQANNGNELTDPFPDSGSMGSFPSNSGHMGDDFAIKPQYPSMPIDPQYPSKNGAFPSLPYSGQNSFGVSSGLSQSFLNQGNDLTTASPSNIDGPKTNGGQMHFMAYQFPAQVPVSGNGGNFHSLSYSEPAVASANEGQGQSLQSSQTLPQWTPESSNNHGNFFPHPNHSAQGSFVQASLG
jgi:hypothetical protein